MTITKTERRMEGVGGKSRDPRSGWEKKQQQEKDVREGNCFYCHHYGHMAWECERVPNKPVASSSSVTTSVNNKNLPNYAEFSRFSTPKPMPEAYLQHVADISPFQPQLFHQPYSVDESHDIEAEFNARQTIQLESKGGLVLHTPARIINHKVECMIDPGASFCFIRRNTVEIMQQKGIPVYMHPLLDPLLIKLGDTSET